MPKYIVNGKTYNIPEDKVEGFERKYPDANVEYSNEGKTYHIPINKREGFLKQYPNAMLGSFNQSTQPTATQPQPDNEEYIEGFGKGVKQGMEQLAAGIKYAGAEGLDFVSHTAKDNAEALTALEQMQAEGKDVAKETKADAKSVLLPLLGHSGSTIDMVARLFGKKNPIAKASAEADSDRTIRRALKETSGDVEAAKALLEQRASEQTTADRWREEAAQKMNEAKPTKGFGAWVGNFVPQMAGTLTGLGLSAITKSPVPAQILGMGQMGALTAATAGASMKEARDAGATNGEVWATGLADAAVELATEAIPFKRYISPLVNQARTKVVKEMADAVLDGKSPARNELQELLAKANEQLGGKLFSNKNVWDYIKDVGAEGLSEFAAEALQTITPMIYAEPENYPTLWEVVNNGAEGLKGGIFMGSILGGASQAATHRAQRDRRKEQGYVDVAEVKLNDKGETGIVEVVDYNPKDNTATVLHEGELITIDNATDNIIEDHRFTFEEFDRGQIEVEQEESYNTGSSLETPQEKNDAKNTLEFNAQEMRRVFGLPDDADVDEALGEDPLTYARQQRDNDPEIGQIVLDYINAKAVYDGMIDNVNDRIDNTIAQSNKMIDSRVSKTDGMIHPATLKLNDRKVYVVDGKVSTLEDNSIDTANSDESIIIMDAETGKVEFSEPSALFTIDTALDPEQEKAAAGEVIANTIADEAEREIDGVLPFNVGDTYTILDDQGAQHTVQIAADNGDNTVQMVMDGEAEATTATKDMVQQMAEAYNLNRLAIAQTEKKAAEAQQNIANNKVEQPVEEAQPAPRIPMDESGNPVYESAPVYDTWAELLELNEGNEEEAIDTANIMRENAQAELDKAMEAPKVAGKTVPQIQAAKAQQKALIKQAQDKLNYWTDVANYRDAQIELMKRAEQRANMSKAQAASQEKGRYSEENAALGAPIDFRDHVMRAIATGGVRFIWSDAKSGTRGLGSHTGLSASNEERNKRIWMLSNDNGLYPEEVAEQLLTSYAEELGYTPNIDTMDALSEILDVVGSYATPSSMFEAAKSRHEEVIAEATEQETDDAYYSYKRAEAEANGMTLDEWLDYEEYVLSQDLPRFEENYDGIIATFVEAAQEAETLNNYNDESSRDNEDVSRRVHQESGLSDGSQTGIGVLQGTQMDNGIANSRGAEAGQGSDVQTIKSGTNDISASEVSGGAKVDNGYNGRSLTTDEAKAVVNAMQQNAIVVELLDLTPENWIAQFGEDGIIDTPIGNVKMGENQYFKLAQKGREGKLGMIKPTLQSPDIIVEEKSSAKNGQTAERNSSYVFVKAFTNTDGSRNYLFTSVTIRKDGKEVVISNQEKETPRIERLLKEGKLAYISKATLPSESTNSTQGNQSTILGGAILSESKDNAIQDKKQGFEKKNSVLSNTTDTDKTLSSIENDTATPENAVSSESKDTITEQQKQEVEQKNSQPERISLNDYLSRLGLSSPISDYMDDKLRNPRGLTANQRKQLERDAANAADAYQQKRSEAVRNYAKLVDKGAIIPASNIDTLVSKANGHPDNESTMAARRALNKRGYDWATGGKATSSAETTPSAVLSEEEYVNRGLAKRKPEEMSAEDWEYSDEYTDAYNEIIDTYPDYIQTAGFEVSDLINTNKTKKSKAKKSRGQELMENLGLTGEEIRFRRGELTDEEQIIADTEANGTYLKAPNGEPTNLTPEQWVQVRTKAFKNWFGDWEKAARIEKLRKSKNAKITGNEIEASEDLKQYKKNAQMYGRTLQGQYTNADTGTVISLQRGRHNGGTNEVLQHNYKDVAHLQSVAAIPQIIENGIYIESQPNADTNTNPNVAEYQMFVCGLNIGGEDYTVLAKVAVDNKGNRYYDHNLVSIEKGKLIDIANNDQPAISSGFGTTPDTKSTTNSQRKYKELISLLQTNSSKIVDANGEPKVVEHSTWNDDFYTFDMDRLGESSGDEGLYGAGFYFGNVGHTKLYGDRAIQTYLNANNPLMLPEYSIMKFFDYIVYNFDKQGLRDIIVKQGGKSTTLGEIIDAIKEVQTNHRNGGYDELIESMKQYWTPSSAEDRVIEQTIFRKVGLAFYRSLESFIENNIGRRAFSDGLRNAGFDGVVFNNTEYVVFNPNQIKSATDNTGAFNASNEDIRFRVSDPAPTFYSNAERAVENVKQEKATPEQWLKMIEKNGGLKAGEDKWLGLSDWLEFSNKKTLTKDEVMEYIRQNQIRIEEVEYAENPQGFEELKKEYDGWLRDGGYDYAWDKLIERYGYDSTVAFDDVGGELVVQYGNTASKLLGGEVSTINNTRLDYTTNGLENKREIALTVPTIEPWNQSDEVHFGDAGNGRAIAWVRFGETTDAEGNRVLVIDEVQSKRHQEGREKGYIPAYEERVAIAQDNLQKAEQEFENRRLLHSSINDNLLSKYGIGFSDASYGEINELRNAYEDMQLARAGVDVAKDKLKRILRGERDMGIPSAPFEKNWAELAMKRMLRYAAENGFDKIAWTTGEQQADRYDLSKTVDVINAERNEDGTYNINVATVDDSHFVQENNIPERRLPELVGKDMALSIVKATQVSEDGKAEIEGDNLRIGGSGMKAFYDQMIPLFMNKYGKKWGVKVGEVTMPNLEENNTMHSIDVTDAMRESVMQGQPMFHIANYDRQFDALQREYDALDKNDAGALNEWRDKKTYAVRNYLNHIKERFGMQSELITFNGANEEQMQQAYQQLVASYEANGNVNPPTYKAFKEKSLRKNVVGTYRKGGDVVTFNATADDTQNLKMQFAETMFHENAHRVSYGLYSNKEFESIWTDAKKAKDRITKMVKELYTDQTDVRKGKEYIAKAVGYLANKHKDSFMQFLRGEMSAENLLKKLRSNSKIANFAVEETLNSIRDEYRVQLSRRGDTSRLGGVGYGSSLQDTRVVLQGDGRTEQGRRADDTERGLRGRVLKAATDLAASLGVKMTVIEDVNDITDPNARQQRAKRGAKAWYNIAADEVVFVAPNATSVEDAVQTVLHEVVAHKGLRDVVGRDHFEEFLDKVFQAADPDTRSKIVALAAKNGWDFRVATEEYMADLAEEGFDKRENRTFWEKVRDLFMDMLREAKIALGFNINDNDMRYMLWRTYQMQRSKGTMSVAEDVVKQQKMGVGNYRSRSMTEAEQIIADAKVNGTYLKAPNGKDTNLTPKQWVTVRTDAFKKWFGNWENDPANASKVVDANGEPKVVYNGSKVQHYNYDGRLRTKGQSATNSKVSFFTDNKAVAERYGKFVNEVFLNIRNPYEIDYNGAGWQGWSGAADGKQRASTDSYADLLANGAVDSTLERIIENYGRAEADYLASGSVRNEGVAPDGVIAYEVADPMRSTLYIVRNAEAKNISRNSVTPKGVETFTNLGKSSLLFDSQIKSASDNVGTFNPSDDDIRYRVAPSTPSTGEARRLYDDAVRRYNKKNNIKKTENLWHHLREAYQDSMLSLKKLQEAVLKETGNKLRDFEDAYTAENHLSSKNKAEIEAWERDYMKPLWKELFALMKKGASYNDIVDYLLAKHGLERNLEFSRKEAEEKGETWDGFVKRDYSGLTELTGEAEVFTEAAQQIVDEFESKYNTDNLWSKINAATKESLRKSYDSGLMSKETYDKVSTMFKYYVPLRGWANDVAADQYEYISDKGMKIMPVLKTAKGRVSRAEDPIATLGSVGESSIIQGNRNVMKQRFLNFAQSNPTSLLTVSEQWYVKQADGTWRPDSPIIPEGATGDEVDAIVKQHEADMEALGANATKKRQGLNIDLHTTRWEQEEHAVNVKRNGKEYKIFVNGNPIAAMAINGLTNPNASEDSLIKGTQRLKNFMARVFTSQNPAFIITNLTRDLIWAGSSVAIKEDAAYTRRYTGNMMQAFKKAQLPRLIKKWKDGTLDMDIPIERYFKEFIENGAETGFTQLNTIDDYKRNLERFLKEAQGGTIISKGKKAWRGFWDGVEFLNRSAEDTTRFMVYLTSRQMGRSITESVANAKDVTVNFNRKGRGNLGAKYMNQFYIFFNATIQSLANFGKLISENPKKTTAALTTFTAAGILAPMVSLALQSLLSDDDDEPTYWDLPEWTRRNNIVIHLYNGTFLTIPLPHELRPFYGMGELALSAMMGKETPEDAAVKAAAGFASLLPFDYTGNGGNPIVNFTPTIAQPLAQLVINKDYFGTPIYRDTPYNKLDPEWTKAYKSSNQVLVGATELLNEITGGDAVKSGVIDINPAIVEHLFESYLGGLGKTLSRTAKTFSMLWDEDAREWRNAPVASSFIQQADERTSGSQANREYFAATDEAEDVEHLYSGYRKRAAMGSMEYAEKLNELINSDVFKRYQTINSYQNAVNKLNTALKGADATDREEIETAIMELKAEMLEELEKLEESSNK